MNAMPVLKDGEHSRAGWKRWCLLQMLLVRKDASQTVKKTVNFMPILLQCKQTQLYYIFNYF